MQGCFGFWHGLLEVWVYPNCAAGVVTAMIGHFTSFGLGKKAFPAKLKDKQQQRLTLAERLLERELVRERKVAVVPGRPAIFIG